MQYLVQDCGQFQASGGRPDQRAGTRQRHMLPRPGVFFLIACKTVDADGGRPLFSLRPQAGIDLVKRPGGGRHVKRGAHPLGEPVEIEGDAKRAGPVGLAIQIAVEQKNQVQVRRMGQNPATQAAQTQNHQIMIGYVAMNAGKFPCSRRCANGQCRFGGARQGPRDVQRVLHRLDQLHAQGETRFAHHAAYKIQLVFVGCAVRRGHAGRDFLDRAGQIQRACVDQGIEQIGAAREFVRKRGGERQDRDQLFQQARAGFQQTEQVYRAGQIDQQAFPAVYRAIGVGRGG